MDVPLLGANHKKFVEALKASAAAEQKAKSSQSLAGSRSGSNVAATIKQIQYTAQTVLAKYVDQYLLLKDEQSIREYFDAIIDYGMAAIDTETTGLDTMVCKIVGLCLYVPGKKPCYIPIGHVGYVTQTVLGGQVSKDLLKELLDKCYAAGVKWVLHNAKFDMRVIKHTIGSTIIPYWDTMIAAKLLNENESAALKNLHLKYCKSQDDKALTISNLFDGLNFALIPMDCAYLYAAGDAIKTWELYEFQYKYLFSGKLEGPKYVFEHIEMPLIPVLAQMEDNGIYVDKAYAKSLQVKYHTLLEEAEKACYDCLAKYQDKIDLYKRLTPNHKLSDPIGLGSSTQIAILLYDIFKLEPKSTKDRGKRGTGEQVISQLDHEFPKLLLRYREMAKLISTYIDKLPAIVNPQDGKIHCGFNAYGAATGRMSSVDPKFASWGHKIRLIQGRAVA